MSKQISFNRASFPLALMSLLLAGCSGINAGAFTFRENVAIDEEKLRLDGYYYYPTVEASSFATGGVVHPLLLWADGTAAFFGAGVAKFDEDYDPEDGPLEYGTIEEAHEVFLRRLRSLERDKDSPVEWGAFRIQGDTIRIQVFRPVESRLGGLDVIDYAGVILSDTTFVITTPGYPESGWQETFRFHPLEEKPPSTNWTQTHPDLQ